MTEVSTPPGFTIDLNDAVKVALRQSRMRTPVEFRTPDGRSGWVVQLPGGHPLATPAYADGRLFLGGGYGSYDFYALDAESGSVLWKIRTSDDGPTAAVVEGRYVAFNTESCSIIVCDVKTGSVVWEQWLGDPLLSQPAIDQGRLYIAYPTGQRPPRLKEPGHHDGETTGHALLCVELATGEMVWERPISGDVITAPVIDDGRVYATCYDGRSYCFDGTDGAVIWEEENRGTSAPLIVGRRIIVTEKQTDETTASGVPLERLHRRYAGSGAAYGSPAMASKMAKFLSREYGGGSAVPPEKSAGLDAAVGFSSPPAAAKLDAAAMHLGVGSVAGAWAYQGSRPAYRNGRVFTSQGSSVHCVFDHGEDKDTQTAWEDHARGDRVDDAAQAFLPPALGGDCLYLAGMMGHLVCLRQDQGEVEFIYDFERPMSAQPCLARGSAYLGTLDGCLVCLRTGREDADGWYMWGGNARHNKTA